VFVALLCVFHLILQKFGRCFGDLVLLCTSVLVFWCTDVLVVWYSGVLGVVLAALVFRCPSVLVS